MRRVFVDSVYWIALINPMDQWFEKAHLAARPEEGLHLITTSEVLIETLNFYAERGPHKRQAAADLIRSILLDIRIEIVPATQDGFLDGLDLYESRSDKGYSLTDCISMNVCRARQLVDVLTHDDHFQQEGFNVLL